MTWTRKSLRIWSALWLALVIYAAAPHVHGDPRTSWPGTAVARTTDAPAAMADVPSGEATNELRRDDAHESHSHFASIDSHPCTLCRVKSDRALAGISTTPVRRTTATAVRTGYFEISLRPELLLARRHPARGPPAIC